MDLLYFVVLVGALIFVHELGHFAWAKIFGVRVLKFSLGFGPKLFGLSYRNTDYVVSAIPLGGYVRMLGENPKDPIPAADAEQAFHAKALWKRLIIVAAGPAMNLLFPIGLYFLVFLGDAQVPPPVIGSVFPDYPAFGQLQSGDRVLSVDGIAVESFDHMARVVAEAGQRPLRFVVQRHDKKRAYLIEPVMVERQRPLDLSEQVARIGVTAAQPLPIIGIDDPQSPAARAGLHSFDRVTAVGGRPVSRWSELDAAFRGRAGVSIPVSYLRPRRVGGALGGLIDLEVYEARVATVTPSGERRDGASRVGIEAADLYLSGVLPNTPEHQLGLRRGDRVRTLDGAELSSWASLLLALRRDGARPHQLTWTRNGETHSGTLRLRHERGTTEMGQRYDRYAVGMRQWVPKVRPKLIDNPSPLGYALRESIRATGEVIELTLVSVLRLFQGKVSVKSIGGPLMIFDVAGTAARAGPLNFLTLMAFISVNLGLLNLLPVPMLDGGHVLFFTAEALLRRPVSVRVREYASITGMVLLMALMVLAFKNDVERQWPRIVDSFEAE